uniref:BHLH domain-containing protein n=1 Tax=Macrostomum lignano TaxID=282301 RepID=A0A1I8F3T5_9PLAT
MRRDKMNGYIQEMASLVPLCRSASRKLDKLTVMRMTAQHLKTLRLRRLGNVAAAARGGNGPGMQLAEAASHLFSTSDLQRIIQNRDLIGHNLFDIVHPKDVNLVKEQLVQPDSLQDSKESSLTCRNEFRLAQAFLLPHQDRRWAQLTAQGRLSIKQQFRIDFHSVVRQYEDLHCSGFVHWPTTEASTPATASASASASSSSNAGGELKPKGGTAAATAKPEPKLVGQLVLLCRPAVSADAAGAAVPARTKPEAAARQFHRLTLEGRISWVDLRVTPLLGHLPQDLQDGSLYDLVSREDLHLLSVAHASVLKSDRSRVTLQQCRLHSGWSNGEPAVCSLSLQCFANPLTQSPDRTGAGGDDAEAEAAKIYFKEDQAQQDVNGDELNGENEGEEATPQDEAFVDSGAPLPLMGQPF